LLLNLRRLATEAGIRHVEASVLPDNRRMLGLARELGFSLKALKPADYSTIELGKELDDGEQVD
jgi:RimJ/RimL family protein N-acetyltransferase